MHQKIHKELLELTTIGVFKQPNSPTNRKKFKYGLEEVYFNDLISNVLNNNSYIITKLFYMIIMTGAIFLLV